MTTLAREIAEARVAPGRLRIWWLGQAGLAIKSPSIVLYVDPYLSDCAERLTKGTAMEHVRMRSAPMAPDAVDHAGLVLCTHDHIDHIDPDGLPRIARASRDAEFVVSACARERLEDLGIESGRIHTLQGDDALTLRGVEISAVPAMHEAFDKDPEKGYPYLSYVIRLEGHTLFHAGDTIPYPGQAERVFQFGVDLAFLPINGRDAFRQSIGIVGNFTCEEAVGFALAIRAGLTVPVHYDMFTLNTVDVNEFRRIADHRGLRYTVMEHAGALDFPPGAAS